MVNFAERVGWTHAVAVSALTLCLLVLAFFYVPHWILVELKTPARSVRVWMATAWTAAAFALACYTAWRASVSTPPSPDA